MGIFRVSHYAIVSVLTYKYKVWRIGTVSCSLLQPQLSMVQEISSAFSKYALKIETYVVFILTHQGTDNTLKFGMEKLTTKLRN